jgi:hypothetical protein
MTHKDAVDAARRYASELFPPEELRGLRVEEISASDDQKQWHVTLGWVEKDTKTVIPSAFSNSLSQVVEVPRVYKKFTIDAESGAVIKMEMRF